MTVKQEMFEKLEWDKIRVEKISTKTKILRVFLLFDLQNVTYPISLERMPYWPNDTFDLGLIHLLQLILKLYLFCPYIHLLKIKLIFVHVVSFNLKIIYIPLSISGRRTMVCWHLKKISPTLILIVEYNIILLYHG